jgi:hypothetical protein
VADENTLFVCFFPIGPKNKGGESFIFTNPNALKNVKSVTRSRIFSQAGNELGASLFPARNKLSMLFPCTLFPSGNELILKLTKNTASGMYFGNWLQVISDSRSDCKIRKKKRIRLIS